MQTDALDVQVLGDRLHSLERRQRVLTALCCGAALVLPLVAFAWQDPKPAVPKELKAESFVLVDGQGKTRGELSFNKDGSPQFLLNDTAGKSMVKLFINKDSESIGIFADKTGTTRVGIAVDGAAHPHVLLSDKGGKPRMQLAVSDQGAPSLICIDINGYMNAGIGMHADGTTWIRNEKPASRPADK
jgi:hypothetical protein